MQKYADGVFYGMAELRNDGIDGMASGKKFNQQNAKIL
jgi:hypothetical protein